MLAREPELRLSVPLMTGLTAFIMALLALILYRGERHPFSWCPALILGVALALRLLFLFAPAQLSDDIYRYLWDGGNLLRGVNPYTAAPAAMTPPDGLKAVHAAINHPEYVTIYPPAAQVLFAAGSAIGGTVTGLKTFLVLLDLVLCGLLILLLRRLQMPVWRAVLYAWNPLPVLEIAGSGHVDGGGMALFLTAFLLLLTCGGKRAGAACSGAVFAAAALVKLFPLALGPVLFLIAPRPRRLHFLAGFCCGLALLSIPFLPDLIRIRESLGAYARNWEFAGFAFNTLRGATGSGSFARLALVAVLLLFVAALTSRVPGLPNAPNDAASAKQGRHALRACYAITMALLLTTPTLQPWYALMLAALLPFAAGPAGIVLCWTVLLTYRVQIPYFILGQWIESPPLTAAVFLAPAAAWLASVLSRRLGEKSGISAPCGN
ncbi:glycosyltransferase 87 family protein [Geomonas subterranea]|uniref:glycosyltransferase 87 family protein n=1 Tax=Geomonas subterranea TaxID=2847989 RepID=UPI001CD31D9E|nr:glycosyltransferase 87 family protein [Geomonas fuzhouensis]